MIRSLLSVVVAGTLFAGTALGAPTEAQELSQSNSGIAAQSCNSSKGAAADESQAAESICDEALLRRLACLAANATQTQLQPGDDDLSDGDILHAAGVSDFFLGVSKQELGDQNSAAATLQWEEEQYAAAAANYDAAKIKYDDGAEKFNDANWCFFAAKLYFEYAWTKFDLLLQQL